MKSIYKIFICLLLVLTLSSCTKDIVNRIEKIESDIVTSISSTHENKSSNSNDSSNSIDKLNSWTSIVHDKYKNISQEMAEEYISYLNISMSEDENKFWLVDNKIPIGMIIDGEDNVIKYIHPYNIKDGFFIQDVDVKESTKLQGYPTMAQMVGKMFKILRDDDGEVIDIEVVNNWSSIDLTY